ncbi:FlaG/FlaF family flagellin (archaellin) [Methanomicrobium sp. W14]|uniref:type IV pilin N-terminal domain-containing protein n=1 Tax=Methanomicrobium sp. W14 TaxID=2817839 RepID=UPI001AE2EF3E|nr:type IV pilin N-terminal domain-containing protein [Methanomicrobium sp. W14]MBP2134413.1 FlaG/FlaF family flagellin (archaellin) [Methanomicrobium sp. W14]
MKKKLVNCEDGVSPIIGEMLMLSLVLILVSLFAVSVSQYIPDDREPSVNLMIGDNTSDNGQNITLWHKGGDTLAKRDMKVIFSNDSLRYIVPQGNITIDKNVNQTNFMPGDNMEVGTGHNITGFDVQVVVSKSVVFFGRVNN